MCRKGAAKPEKPMNCEHVPELDIQSEHIRVKLLADDIRMCRELGGAFRRAALGYH
jgi:hypothetical protein